MCKIFVNLSLGHESCFTGLISQFWAEQLYTRVSFNAPICDTMAGISEERFSTVSAT